MTFSAPALKWTELLRLAANLGYDGVEPRVESGHQHGIELDRPPAELAECARQAAEAGVAICCIATGLRFADPSPCELLEAAGRHIELAAAVGCPMLRVFGGPIPEKSSREEAIDWVAGSLRRLAPDAAKAGVTICLETHDAWTNPRHVAEVMRRVDHPAVAVNWDMMHPTFASGFSIRGGFDCLRQWVRHVHIHDGHAPPPLRFARCGEGELDMKAAIQVLQGAGYQGFVSGEWIQCDGMIDLADELARMKALEASLTPQVA